MTTQTSMEKIKAFHSMKSFLNEEQQKEIGMMLGLTYCNSYAPATSSLLYPTKINS
ncbi:hypothetical protein GNF78_18220 [Clostridium perfringens]